MKKYRKLIMCFTIVFMAISLQCVATFAIGKNQIREGGVLYEDQSDLPDVENPSTDDEDDDNTVDASMQTTTAVVGNETETEATTTEAPPATEAPTTEAPTTEAPTTEASTTETPTTEEPSTQDKINDNKKTEKVQTTEYKEEEMVAVNESDKTRIERADSNNTKIRVYYYIEDGETHEVNCKLDGIELAYGGENAKWSELGYRLNMYVLISTSQTTNEDDFNMIKSELISLLDKMNNIDDKLIIYSTEGGFKEVGKFGKNDAALLTDALNEINATDSDVKLYESIDKLADEVGKNANTDLSPMRNVMLVISDGNSVDSPEEFGDKGIKGKLINSYVSMYYIQMKSDDISQEKIIILSENAKNSGGETFVFADGSERISSFYDKLMECQVSSYIIDKEKCYYSAVHKLELSYKLGEEKKNIGSSFISVNALSEDKIPNTDDEVEKSSNSKEKKDVATATDSDGEKDDESKPDEDKTKKLIILICVISLIMVIAVVAIAVSLIKRKKNRKLLERNESRNNQKTYETLPETEIQMTATPVQQPVNSNNVNIKPQYAVKPVVIEVWFRGNVVKQIKTNINGSIIVGRANICDVVIDNQMVSRQHFAMEFDGVDIYIQDLETRNGTYVNGTRITQKIKLNLGDKIKIGSLDLVIRW